MKRKKGELSKTEKKKKIEMLYKEINELLDEIISEQALGRF